VLRLLVEVKVLRLLVVVKVEVETVWLLVGLEWLQKAEHIHGGVNEINVEKQESKYNLYIFSIFICELWKKLTTHFGKIK
jgi:hypothetical protein